MKCILKTQIYSYSAVTIMPTIINISNASFVLVLFQRLLFKCSHSLSILSCVIKIEVIYINSILHVVWKFLFSVSLFFPFFKKQVVD